MKCSICKINTLDKDLFCEKCDAKTCDVCGRKSIKVKTGRWLFYCTDNPACKDKEMDHISQEMNSCLNDGTMPDYEVLNNYI